MSADILRISHYVPMENFSARIRRLVAIGDFDPAERYRELARDVPTTPFFAKASEGRPSSLVLDRNALLAQSSCSQNAQSRSPAAKFGNGKRYMTHRETSAVGGWFALIVAAIFAGGMLAVCKPLPIKETVASWGIWR